MNAKKKRKIANKNNEIQLDVKQTKMWKNTFDLMTFYERKRCAKK